MGHAYTMMVGVNMGVAKGGGVLDVKEARGRKLPIMDVVTTTTIARRLVAGEA
jgi:hypothetical protein